MVGKCRSRLEKYYYDQNTGLCKTFYYSGCRGGANMFDSINQCVETCVQQEQLSRASLPQDLYVADPCQQDKVVGPCRAKKSRWFFNKESQNCEPFEYSGCRGNDNNFETQLDCQAKCQPMPNARSTQINVSPFDLPFTTLPERVPDRPLSCKTKEDLKTCLEVIRDNGIKCEEEDSLVIPEITISSLEQRDPCLEEKAVGRCKASFPRYHFDKDTRSCKPFNYGGCMGNGNNFANQASCEQVCSKHLGQNDRIPRQETRLRPTPKNEICKMAMDAGPCFALMPRYYFNFATRRCEEFLYGG